MRPEVELASPWRFPTPEARTWPSGLTTWVYDLPGQHIAALDLVLPVQLSAEPLDLEGVATVALNSIDEGTHSNPDGRIAELLELQGTALHGSATVSHTRLGADFPVRRLAAVAPLLAEVISSPAHAEDDISHHVGLLEAAHESRLASPGAVAKQAFRTALFGSGAREGRALSGTPETLARIGRDAVVAWHGSHWVPAGATLVLAGDLGSVDPYEALAPLTSWTAPGDGSVRVDPDGVAPRIVIANMPEAVQATVHVGTLLPGRHHSDWEALKLGVHAFVGAFASRLNLELRERLGYTYGVHGGIGGRSRDGQLTLSSSFRTEVAADAISRILQGLELADPFTAEEVDDARKYLLGIAPLANETASDIVRQATVLAAAGEEPGYVNQHFDALALPGADDVTAAFRRHITPGAMTIAISGNADELVPALRAAGLEVEVVERGA